jgi:hypothetical protein
MEIINKLKQKHCHNTEVLRIIKHLEDKYGDRAGYLLVSNNLKFNYLVGKPGGDIRFSDDNEYRLTVEYSPDIFETTPTKRVAVLGRKYNIFKNNETQANWQLSVRVLSKGDLTNKWAIGIIDDYIETENTTTYNITTRDDDIWWYRNAIMFNNKGVAYSNDIIVQNQYTARNTLQEGVNGDWINFREYNGTLYTSISNEPYRRVFPDFSFVSNKRNLIVGAISSVIGKFTSLTLEFRDPDVDMSVIL